MRSMQVLSNTLLLTASLVFAGSAAASIAPCESAGDAQAIGSIELARTSSSRSRSTGGRNSRRDDNFDPYGKDDPTSPKWGRAHGFGGGSAGSGRYGLGNRVRERDTDEDRARRDERDKRASESEE